MYLKKITTPYAFNYLNNAYNLFYGDNLLVFGEDKPIGLYKFKTDFTLQNNVMASEPDTLNQLSIKIKAFIQQYNNRMVDNNLTPEGSQVHLKGVHQ